MSSSIWTQCAGASRLRPLQLAPWRIVEAQHLVSTRKLVASMEEQAVLEELIDASKPPEPTAARRHVLLSTPFRYPPLRHGSRFGSRQEPSLWYGSETARTMCAELAYYRFVFLEGTTADLGSVSSWHTAFSVAVRTTKGIDLTRQPFRKHQDRIAAQGDYADSQALGAAMRDAGVEAFRFVSARDPDGVNVGVFTPLVFGGSRPREFQTWHCTATRARVEIVRRDFSEPAAYAFARDAFLVDGTLPVPGI